MLKYTLIYYTEPQEIANIWLFMSYKNDNFLGFNPALNDDD